MKPPAHSRGDNHQKSAAAAPHCHSNLSRSAVSRSSAAAPGRAGKARNTSDVQMNRVTSTTDGMLRISPAGLTSRPRAASTGQVPQEALTVSAAGVRSSEGIRSGIASRIKAKQQMMPLSAP